MEDRAVSPIIGASTDPIVVVIDGPAGSGKSSVSREAARRLGFELLDTGAAYRALACFAMRMGIDLDAADVPEQLAPKLDEFLEQYAIALHPDERWVRLGEDDITEAIRSTELSSKVSAVARIPEVRATLTELFRTLLHDTAAPGIIAEGRDLTTVVAPDAPVRLLLTADEAVRIQRRSSEKGGEAAQAVVASVIERDRKDRQVVDFLTPAEGVTLVDTTHLNFEESVQRTIDLIRAARPDAPETI